MANPTKPSRIPPAPWSRLKPITQDPLERIGLPSKGDKRLLDFNTQETYFNEILTRYLNHCASSSPSLAASQTSDLTTALSNLHLNQLPPSAPPSASPTITILHSSLRKLREGLLASSRHDELTNTILTFSIRFSILTSRSTSVLPSSTPTPSETAYIPLLQHLLFTIHPLIPLSQPTLREMSTYLILATALEDPSRADLGKAYAYRAALDTHDVRLVAKVLRALGSGNWTLWWRTRREVDGYLAKVLERGDEAMRVLALKSLGRAYLGVEKRFVESSLGGMHWLVLKERYAVGWEVEGDRVVIRKFKPRAIAAAAATAIAASSR